MSADNDINRKLKEHISFMEILNTLKILLFVIANMNKK